MGWPRRALSILRFPPELLGALLGRPSSKARFSGVAAHSAASREGRTSALKKTKRCWL